MKKLIVSLALASSALIAAAPASAQYYGRPDYGRPGYGFRADDIRERLQRIEYRIDRNFQRGSLTRGEAQRLRSQADNIQRLAWRYGRDGLSGWERGDLERRIGWLQDRLQRERFDDDRRGWRY
jgi:hypothetical protein